MQCILILFQDKHISGLGGVARLVMLPEESHGYRSRESVLHRLYEQSEWIERYVKNAEEISTN
jgi:dipeptidyl aminopeptidase/acylaminoacyl peptidase